jgi:hypothetical protein
MAEIEKKDELRNRYFYEQIIWGEKERHKLNQKSKKYMERRRNKERGLSEVNKPPENTAAAPPAKPAQNPQPKPILLYQGDTKRRSSVLSIPDASLFPKTTQNGQIVNLYNLVNKNPNA